MTKPKNKTQPKKECHNCKKNLVETNFYKCDNSPLFPDSRFHICSNCLGQMMEQEDGYEIALMALHAMNKPMISERWNNSSNGRDYFRQINSLGQYKNMTWQQSDFEGKQSEENTYNNKKKKFNATDELKDKWGFGYTDEEYEYFERKYNTLKNNYQEKTSMHTEALLTYIRYRVKEEISTAKGQNKEAKDWGTLASNAAKDAKINPAQLSQADLSDGLDTFGQLIRAVETSEDIIPILPQFKEKAHDKVDFALWCYVNYIRDMQGKDLVDYKKVYEFYEERKKEQEEEFVFDKGSDS